MEFILRGEAYQRRIALKRIHKALVLGTSINLDTRFQYWMAVDPRTRECEYLTMNIRFTELELHFNRNLVLSHRAEDIYNECLEYCETKGQKFNLENLYCNVSGTNLANDFYKS